MNLFENKQNKIALNTSTLMPFKLGVKDQIKVAMQSEYTGIELWINDIEVYMGNGGKLSNLRNYAKDCNVQVVNGISFTRWSDSDKNTRVEALEQAKREMQMLMGLDCKAIAAPPIGNVEGMSMDEIASNFAKLCTVALDFNIEPYLEVWGQSPVLNTLSDAMYILLQSEAQNGKLLLDIYHLFKGGSDYRGMKFLSGNSIGIFHVNDYPKGLPRKTALDKDRVFPGDGCAPVKEIFSLLKDIGYQGYMSLELFRQDYGITTASIVAKKGCDKITQIISKL
jgi:sugar phosphate isomerase/epimerase